MPYAAPRTSAAEAYHRKFVHTLLVLRLACELQRKVKRGGGAEDAEKRTSSLLHLLLIVFFQLPWLREHIGSLIFDRDHCIRLHADQCVCLYPCCVIGQMCRSELRSGCAAVERLGKGLVPPPAHVRLLVRFCLRQYPVKRREVGKTDFRPSAGKVGTALAHP